jgi:hypothetical protein
MQKNKSLQSLICDFGLPYIFQVHSFQIDPNCHTLALGSQPKLGYEKKKRLRKVSQDINTFPHLKAQKNESQHSQMDFH